MKSFILLSDDERQELFQEAATRLGIMPAIVEKDFWVTWMLSVIFSDSELSQQLMFKGGTSLSKVYGLIERFSEDIDLILNWQKITDKNPNDSRSKTQDGKLSKLLNEEAKNYIATVLLDRIKQGVGTVCTVEVDSEDGFIINVQYPTSFLDSYLRPEIRLEIGPMAVWNPHETHSVTSLVASEFPQLFKNPHCEVNVIMAKRTFWEKATILHAEAHRPKEKPLPVRYSRHYYDLAQMANSPVKEEALDDLILLEQVVEFKQRFYPAAWANYPTAKPGSFKLIPEEKFLKKLAQDYQTMQNMIYGDYPSFDHLIQVLADLEDAINQPLCTR